MIDTSKLPAHQADAKEVLGRGLFTKTAVRTTGNLGLFAIGKTFRGPTGAADKGYTNARRTDLEVDCSNNAILQG